MSVSQSCKNIMNVLTCNLCVNQDYDGLKQIKRLVRTMMYITPELEECLSTFAVYVLIKDKKHLEDTLKVIEKEYMDEVGDRVFIVLKNITNRF